MKGKILLLMAENWISFFFSKTLQLKYRKILKPLSGNKNSLIFSLINFDFVHFHKMAVRYRTFMLGLTLIFIN